jgi:hypothetical protein
MPCAASVVLWYAKESYVCSLTTSLSDFILNRFNDSDYSIESAITEAVADNSNYSGAISHGKAVFGSKFAALAHVISFGHSLSEFQAFLEWCTRLDHFETKWISENMNFFPSRDWIVRPEDEQRDVLDILVDEKDRILKNFEISTRHLDKLFTVFGKEDSGLLHCFQNGHCSDVYRKLIDSCGDNFKGLYEANGYSLEVSVKQCLKERLSKVPSSSSPVVPKVDEITFIDNGTRFQIISELGRGSFGTAFLVEISKTHKQAVLKFNRLLPNYPFQFQSQSRDIQAMRLLPDNPWLVELIGSVGDKHQASQPFVVMDTWYVNPGVLMELLIPEEQPDEYCIYLQSLRGLGEILDLGYVHEDIGRRNVIPIKNNKETFTLNKTYSITCNKVKFIDTGSLNSVDGTQLPPLENFDEVIDRETRRKNPQKFVCAYLEYFHYEFDLDLVNPYFEAHGHDIFHKFLLKNLLQRADCADKKKGKAKSRYRGYFARFGAEPANLGSWFVEALYTENISASATDSGIFSGLEVSSSIGVEYKDILPFDSDTEFETDSEKSVSAPNTRKNSATSDISLISDVSKKSEAVINMLEEINSEFMD